MRKLSIAALIAVGSSLAAYSSAGLIDQNDGTAAVWEANTSSSEASLSDNFESSLATADIIAVDDFQTTQAYYLNTFQFGLEMYSQGGANLESGITGFHVELYTDTGAPPVSLTGNVASFNFTGLTAGQSATVTASAAGYAGFSTGYLMTLNMGGYQLAAGTYWIGVSMDSQFSTNGNAAIMSSTQNSNSALHGPDAWWINPGGYWGFAGNEMQPLNSSGSMLNLSETLSGSATPEPASLGFLGLGLLGLVARRRRSSK